MQKQGDVLRDDHPYRENTRARAPPAAAAPRLRGNGTDGVCVPGGTGGGDGLLGCNCIFWSLWKV